MRLRIALLVLFLIACGSPEAVKAPEQSGNAAPPPASNSAAATPVASTPARDALDLSSPEASRKTLLDVLKRGDKEAFKKCITTRILARREKHNDFDAWFEVWKSGATDNPSSFSTIRLAEEDGKWKLDEN